MVVSFGVVVVLSRLLTPAEVGIFSITATLITLAAIFREFGVSSYLRQVKELTQENARSALGLIISAAWLMGLGLYFLSAFIANFYNQEGIKSVLTILATSFFVIPFVSYLNALMTRDMMAGKQAIIGLISSLVYGATSIIFAMQGLSYMALAWANLVNVSVQLVLLILMKPVGTSLKPSFTGWGPIARFGSGTALSGFASLTNDAMPELVLGKILGPYYVGIFSRANGLVGMFQQLIGPTVGYIALPLIAKKHHANESLVPVIAKGTSYLTGVAWPIFGFVAVFAEEIIRILYGDQWLPAAPLVTVICLQFAIRTSYTLCAPALTAVAKPHVFSLISINSLVTRLILIYFFGMDGIYKFVIAICIADILTLPFTAYIMAKHLDYSIKQSVKAQAASAIIGFICLGFFILYKHLTFGMLSNFLVVLSASVLSVFIWLILINLLKHPLLSDLILMKNKFFNFI